MRSAGRSKSPAVAVAVLAEAMLIIRFGLREEAQPRGFPLDALDAALESYAWTMARSPGLTLGAVPAAPKPGPLRDAGAEVVPPELFEARLGEREKMRRQTLALVKSCGWHWQDASGEK